MSSVPPNEKIKEVESINNNDKSLEAEEVPAQTINETKETDDSNKRTTAKEDEYLNNNNSNNEEDVDNDESLGNEDNENDNELSNNPEVDYQEKELTAENLDEKQIEEMKKLGAHQEREVPNDQESESLTHLNAEKMNNKDRFEKQLSELPGNDSFKDKKSKEDNIIEQDNEVEEDDKVDANNKEEDEGMSIKEQDDKDNSNYSRNQRQHADAVVEEQLPSIPSDQVPIDVPFKDKGNFIERTSKASIFSDQEKSNDDEREGDKEQEFDTNNNGSSSEKLDDFDNSENADTSEKKDEEHDSLENGSKNDLSDNNDIDPTAPDQDNSQDDMDVDIPTETNDIAFATGEGNKEYDVEEKNQEQGEEEMLSYAQVDDPAFDADFNVEEYDKSADDFDASLLETENDKSKDEDFEMQDVEVDDISKPEEPKTESKISNKSKIGPAKPEIPKVEPATNSTAASEEATTAPSNTEQEEDVDLEDIIEDEEDEPIKATTKYKQTHLVIIPSYASWFNMKKIHKIEKESLPEFFNSTHPSKSPKLYANYRNFMINAYRLNPNEFLTLTSCRRNLVGDVGTLMRVHRFLNKWGLINYQVKPHFKPGYAFEKMPNGSSVDLPYTGDYHVKYDSPRGLFPFDTSRIPPEKIDVGKLKKLIASSDLPGSAGLENGINERGNKKRQLSIEHSNLKEEPPHKRKHKDDNDGWTKEESDNLINAVHKYKNDWYQIASAVGGNKTPQQCVLKFLKLPIEDQFNPIRDSDKEDIKLLKYASNYPINTIDNPVLANLVFMTRIVDSGVAKAASEAAKKAMDESMKKKLVEVYGESKVEENEESTKQKGEIKPDTTKDKEEETEQQNGSIEKEESTNKETKEAIATTFGIVGARSHLFSSYEERELHKISMSIINHELQKCETKLAKIEELEKIYERERQNLSKQQEETFTDRLSLTRSTIDVIKKLEEACSLLENNDQSTKQKELSKLISDARSLLYKPVKQSLEAVGNKENNQQEQLNNREKSSNQLGDDVSNDGSNISEGKSVDDFAKIDDYKPLSLISPQTFKIWAP
ncbi:SWI3 [Candida jiufengensis]|uniref:SWI3 n=1 Tax=Candida jiufengensis TaxID=497108 RepID=UPI0022243C5D|nr:SWI3 [Candida jiufengensis]KAI5955917.1 SWI3 [Candida jiufengensis]